MRAEFGSPIAMAKRKTRSMTKKKEQTPMNYHGLPTHINRPSLRKATKGQRISHAQNVGLRDRKDIKITLAKEPWKKDE